MGNIHLKLGDKIKGESVDDKHKDEINIMSASWSVSNTASNNASVGAGGGKALSSCGDIHLGKGMCKASPEIMAFCASGDSIPDGVLTFSKAVGENKHIDYLTIKMKNLRISSYSVSGSEGGGDMESFALNFSEVEYIYTKEDQGGIKGASVNKKYNFATHKAG
jgi:type VI secretion system secreted protein Hcp